MRDENRANSEPATMKPEAFLWKSAIFLMNVPTRNLRH
jgi:hypothetical protein